MSGPANAGVRRVFLVADSMGTTAVRKLADEMACGLIPAAVRKEAASRHAVRAIVKAFATSALIIRNKN